MLLPSIILFPLFLVSYASSIDEILDSRMESAANNVTVIGPVSELHVTNGVIAPDGYNRSAVLVNGQYPAPLIKANKDDHFSIKLVNGITEESMSLETAVHFHGIFQRKSNWADGAAYVTQCPLRPKEAFVQEFNITGQTGTYWYHSHYALQRCDGVQGPLVIYDPEDPLAGLYDVDDENTVITLSDWYHSPAHLTLASVFPNATLINGKGRYDGGPSVPLSVINVREGSRYRFRVIGMGCQSTFNFTIDGHRMTIIETDGIEVSPVETDSLPVHPGQRYSVIVTANQPVGNYWIRALSNMHNATFDGGRNMAVLRYQGAAAKDPTSPPGPYAIPFHEGKLHPLIGAGAPGIPEIGKADVNLVLAPGFNRSAKQFTLGGMTYADPPVPVLLQILNGARQATQLLPKDGVYVLPANKVVEISFPHPDDAPDGPHPMHLHGNNFDVVRVAGSNHTNFVNPVRRDVVSIGNSHTDNVTVRFITDNAGPWFLHCHMDYHLARGFALVMAVAPDETASEESQVVPQDWHDLCPQTY